VPPVAILSYSIYPRNVPVIDTILTIHRINDLSLYVQWARTVSETLGNKFLRVIYTNTKLQMGLVSGG
jgi:hypothetical protein